VSSFHFSPKKICNRVRAVSEVEKSHSPNGLPWREILNKYLRPIVGGLSVAMTITAAHAQANVQDFWLKPLAPVDAK
jgi:hypothetical protein